MTVAHIGYLHGGMFSLGKLAWPFVPLLLPLGLRFVQGGIRYLQTKGDRT
jgi:hypothetical protein